MKVNITPKIAVIETNIDLAIDRIDKAAEAARDLSERIAFRQDGDIRTGMEALSAAAFEVRDFLISRWRENEEAVVELVETQSIDSNTVGTNVWRQIDQWMIWGKNLHQLSDKIKGNDPFYADVLAKLANAYVNIGQTFFAKFCAAR